MRSPVRRVGLLLSALLCLLVAAGCTKPVPAVTVQSGDKTVRSDAIQYHLDGKLVRSSHGPQVLPVRLGHTVNISVDRATADAGWVVVVGDQRVSPVLTKVHNYSITVQGLGDTGQATMAVFEQPKQGQTDPNGVWLFTLKQQI
jgi:hypothetical protein